MKKCVRNKQITRMLMHLNFSLQNYKQENELYLSDL